MTNPEKLEEIIGIEFKNKDILKEALTHRSYVNEHPNWPVPNNERLEYLGDAVLELVVTEYLYAKYPEFQEGENDWFESGAREPYHPVQNCERYFAQKFIMLSGRGERIPAGRGTSFSRTRSNRF